jgi:hypothetical protein
MRQQRMRMPMPQVAGARAIEATHEHLGSSASAFGRSLTAPGSELRGPGRVVATAAF